jgi:hypothetical protein
MGMGSMLGGLAGGSGGGMLGGGNTGLPPLAAGGGAAPGGTKAAVPTNDLKVPDFAAVLTEEQKRRLRDPDLGGYTNLMGGMA